MLVIVRRHLKSYKTWNDVTTILNRKYSISVNLHSYHTGANVLLNCVAKKENFTAKMSMRKENFH